MRDNPSVVNLQQADGEPKPMVGVALEVRGRAAPQQREGERDVRAGVTSSDSISNTAPDVCHSKNPGQVSRYASRPRTPRWGGGTSNMTIVGAWSASMVPCRRCGGYSPALDQVTDLLFVGHDSSSGGDTAWHVVLFPAEH